MWLCLYELSATGAKMCMLCCVGTLTAEVVVSLVECEIWAIGA